MVKSIIFAGYREWSKKLLSLLETHYTDINWYHAKNPDQLKELYEIQSITLVVLAGWSWILTPEQTMLKDVVGLHPSDLPNYAGGSPIQNQILDGITDTKMSLFKLDSKIDTGKIFAKQDLSLHGSIENIFSSLVVSSFELLKKFINSYPEVEYEKQGDYGKKCKRLRPQDSQITSQEINSMSALELFNFIRCREDPYPNVYIQDETGKLFFKKVEFIRQERLDYEYR